MSVRAEGKRPHVALATCTAYPDLDIDDRLLLEPLRELGIQPTVAIWDDPREDWERFDLVLIRSTWDYTRRCEEFLDWARRMESGPGIANPVDVLAWSSDKTYLQDLRASGVPIVPTTFVAPGQPWTFPDGEFVVKPSISAGSRDTVRLSADNRAVGDRAIAAIHARSQAAMIQPYLHSVDHTAETAMVFLSGHFSHAVSKAALLPLDQPSQVYERGLFLQEKITRRTARADQMAVAQSALRCAPGEWLYARVDLIDDGDGRPVVLELEMVEPSLFLGFADPSGKDPARTLAMRLAATLLGD